MERLTDPCWKNLDPWECCGQDYFCKRGCHEEGGCANGCIVPKIYVRLAHYEGTGLTPEEIKAPFTEDTMINLAAQALGVETSRLRGLAEADKDGRVVVLPCKVGDGLWTFCSHPVEQVYSFTVTDISTLNGRTLLNTSRCGVMDARDVGKTVFLTREEAKKALQEMEGKA